MNHLIEFLTEDETIFLLCAIMQTLCLCYLVLRHP
jgi:hypothetical protein